MIVTDISNRIGNKRGLVTTLIIIVTMQVTMITCSGCACRDEIEHNEPNLDLYRRPEISQRDTCRILALSGGGQKGAFGAGFIAGLRKKGYEFHSESNLGAHYQ